MIPQKDGKTHKDPMFPVGGYAPGNYVNRCSICFETFINMDKRAYQCFPCAVNKLQQRSIPETVVTEKINKIIDLAKETLSEINN